MYKLKYRRLEISTVVFLVLHFGKVYKKPICSKIFFMYK